MKSSTSKCEVARIGVLKGVQVAVCGMKCIDLRNEAIKILGVYFSYNQKIKDDKNFYNIISNIQGVLNLWRMRNLTLEGRMVVFKTLAISKIVFLALLTKIPHQVIKELEMKQPLKSTVFLEGYDNNFHEWKLIPLHLITMSFGSKFKFHSNTFLKKHHLEKLLLFYRDIFINWKTHFSSRLETPACLYSQIFWFKKYIQIEDNFVCLQLKILIFYLNFLKGVV